MSQLFRNIIRISLILLSINLITLSQDTNKPAIKPVAPKDTSTIQNFLLANHNYQYINKTDPDTITRRRFLWNPAKTTEDMFNYLPGYYLNFMDVGQSNPLSYNQMGFSTTGLLRHGRPLNDLIDGSVDMNLLSRNEISEIELSNGFGNNLYNYSNSINIIERELFQFRPYTEISFYQDRYENLYFDGNFHQNFLKTLNYNMGITKHSYDGHYTNSDFDKWLGRFNLNFAPSNKLNFSLNVNYAHIQKGLNGGLDADTLNLGDKEDVFNSTRAIVNNSDAYEIKERFDVDLNSLFLIGKNSYTRLQAYVSNSFRKYRDEENRPNPNGLYQKFNYHWINYGAKLQEVLKFNFNKDLNVISRSEADYNYEIFDVTYGQPITLLGPIFDNTASFQFLENIDVSYKDLTGTGYLRGYTNNPKYLNTYYGFNLQYLIKFDSTYRLKLNGQYNSENNYSSAKAEYNFGQNNIGSEFYYSFDDFNVRKGLNNFFKFRLFKFDLEGTYTYNFVPSFKPGSSYHVYSPNHFGNLSLSWHDVAFKNKLEYKIGFNSRFWSEYYSTEVAYYPDYNLRIPANATLDFFIMGKIGKATFGLTVENVLDRIIYNTGVYPFMDRGGFLNSISRFNITWSFFD